ncbi:helix-turn-helix domain-containing protein [Rubellimicrobium aerolatum]|uniref:Short-chain fatty acyl-CoA regulator family protein n=1 Tax=Rubellimicrobium aerolatum TaxID=490979 RepID=A0ABW0SAS2_9RHOB|nr:short-chain fatty acyl-CoA regulator family protein [Rubellimicrobium aerolatum]MBP1806117.1 putative transcriptional regulator/DNA-binding XRE family transcriptional regulator [Rubellimicrobium aerolatum]
MDAQTRRKIMAGAQLRRLRATLGLSQSAMAAELGISVSYLNLVERNQRPLTAQLLIRLSETYAIDARDFAGAEDGQGAAEIEEVLADPLLAPLQVPRAEVKAALEQAPTLLQALKRLHAAYAGAAELGSAHAGERSEAERGGPPAIDAVEQVRAFLQHHDNHFPALEDAAESLSAELGQVEGDLLHALILRLRARHGIRVQVQTHAEMGVTLRHYDRHRRKLMISELVEPAGRAFQAAYQIGLLEAGDILDALLAASDLRDPQARRLGRITLANYFAAALMMPYGRFLAAAQSLGYDAEMLGARFGASFEQVAHRLTTLSRPQARGVPFFMVRVDNAGNVSKRFSSGAFPFSRFGGTCPRWNVHDVFRHPGRILTQLIEMPDGKRWFSLARTVRRLSAPWGEPEAAFAVGLGCEERFAPQLVYARGLKEMRPTGIGVNCRLCERANCPSRAAPPLLGGLDLSESTRGVSPFGR